MRVCESHILSINWILLDEVRSTFENKESMVANDSLNDHSPLNHNLSLSHQPQWCNGTWEKCLNRSMERFYGASIEQEVIDWVNDSRIELGLKTLERTKTLTMIARWTSEDMAKYHYFSQEGHLVFVSLLDSYQVSFQISGENIFKSQNPMVFIELKKRVYELIMSPRM